MHVSTTLVTTNLGHVSISGDDAVELTRIVKEIKKLDSSWDDEQNQVMSEPLVGTQVPMTAGYITSEHVKSTFRDDRERELIAELEHVCHEERADLVEHVERYIRQEVQRRTSIREMRTAVTNRLHQGPGDLGHP